MTIPPVVTNTDPHRRAGLIAGAVLIGLIIVAVMLRSCGPRDGGDKIPPKTQRSIDSLEITKPAFDSTAAAGRQQVARDTTSAIQHHAAATHTVAAAVVEHHVADSLAQRATQLEAPPNDSAALAWKAAYDARTREADSLRVAVAQMDSAYQRERSARITALALYAADTVRRIAIERVQGELQAAIARLEKPCRIIGPIPCPTRTATLVITAIATAAATYEVAHHAP